MDVWYSSDIRSPFHSKFYMNDISDSYHYFNYTRLTELYGEKYNLAPRFHWSSWHEEVYFVDLKREAEIGVGVSASW